MAYFGEQDLFLFNEGTHIRLHEKLGAHAGEVDGARGTHFAVWAPNAASVSIIGNFNGWEKGRTNMEPVAGSGIWHAFVPGVGNGEVYKYHIQSRERGYQVDKADPFGFKTELPPKTASVTWDLSYEWNDDEWMKTRGTRQHREAPISIYELHVGSWFHLFEEDGHRSYSYRELAEPLARYVNENGFTHVELMPISEHPFYGSWGYQVTGYFAPTARFGDPQDLMYLVDYLHQRGIGVILDWVPAHFPSDEHGLAYFDGTHLFEHADPRRGYHPDWNSLIFNYGRHEVKAFLLSSAVFWLERYHIDGLRVDGVASMLYLDYSREGDDWIPNEYGGNENLEAIDFLRRFNEVVYEQFPSATTIAEESTAWPMVSRPTYLGGLGFGFKWDMGWMHDTLTYFQREPVYRKYHQNDLTFRGVYAFHENFVLPLSHDEVVHGKGSLIDKMPGDDWQKLANLRLLYAYMFSTPGKKLLFMGGEFGQWKEWSHDRSLDWSLLEQPGHRGMLSLMAELNRLYREMPALHELDYTHDGFEWIDASDTENSVIVLARKGKNPKDYIICAFNFTPVPRENYRVGVDLEGHWRELLNTDANDYGGSGVGNLGRVEASPVAWHGRRFSVNLVLPPLGAVWFVHEG